ncbi:hypothetical protein DSO57_1015736 [Entomophthora muscae]|uniref:Uncharacterized protein n=1 Tax=Entomophthora muscae TaxID=34485 RepID=A0ACC2TS16_9FUNG|nr:hypothetical protein DSO57_1015736 [Entomophthora muscae]
MATPPPSNSEGSSTQPKRIHFGSLEHVEKENRNKKPAKDVGKENFVDLENIEFERTKRAKTITVPTDDGKVRARLQELKQPQCLFGEGPRDRRDRLRHLLSLAEGLDIPAHESSSSDSEVEEEFFTIGSQALLECRRNIGEYSLPRAHERLKQQTLDLEKPIAHGKALRQDLFKYLKTYGNYSSQVGDDRPLTQCRFSPDSKLLATGSWSGSVKLWSVPSCKHEITLRGHTDRVSGVAFHPEATVGQSASALNMASGGADNMIYLWSLESDTPLASLVGHVGRVSRVAFHPSGRYLGSASFDTSWRLWDVETTEELLLQEGHSREVFNIGFQPDGSLAATGGLDGIGRVWDLRNGRSIIELRGHVKEILGLDFSPNGHEIATSSEDNTVRIWDMRTLRSVYTIPAHRNIVSEVRYYRGPVEISRQHVDLETKAQSNIVIPVNGLYLATSSYDGFVKMWSADDYRLVHALPAHEGRVMTLDISSDNKMLATGGYDRTFKLWASDEVAL